MKRLLYGKDIFDTAYSYVKNLFLKQHTSSVSVKIRTVSEDYDEDESKSYSETGKDTVSSSASKTGTETVAETGTKNTSESLTGEETKNVSEDGKDTLTSTDTQKQIQTDTSIEYEFTDIETTAIEYDSETKTVSDSERSSQASTESSVQKSSADGEESSSEKNSESESESSSSKEASKRSNETVRESTETAVEDGAELKIRSELEERFPFILASACCELERLDAEYRRSCGAPAQEEFSAFFIGLDDPFPLSDCFAFPCAMYTCSMFLIDSDSDRSDDFFARYSDQISAISAKIPFVSEKTVEKYPY